MATIQTHGDIQTTLDRAYAALTTQDGVRGWWNARCEVSAKVGGESSYRFNKGGTDIKMRFKNDKLDPKGEVVWSCTANDNAAWIGTTVQWKLTRAGTNVRVELKHDGFAADFADTEGYRMVAGGWDHFMGSLKSFIETGKGQPFD